MEWYRSGIVLTFSRTNGANLLFKRFKSVDMAKICQRFLVCSMRKPRHLLTWKKMTIRS